MPSGGWEKICEHTLRAVSYRLSFSESGVPMSIFRRFVSYYKPYRKLFVADIVCAVVLSIIDLSFPQFIRWLPDNLFSGDPAVIYRALRWLFPALMAWYILREPK